MSETQPQWELTEEIRKQLENQTPDWQTQEQPTWQAEDFQLWDYVPAPAVLMAFSSNQKAWIRERDNNECQFPAVVEERSYKACGRKDHLQIHHAVMPQRYGLERGFQPEDLDVPDNGLTLCEAHHNGVVHNDMLVAKLAYGKDKTAFNKAFDKRHDLLDLGKKYWNDAFDGLFQRIIKARNKMMKRPYPYTPKQQKKIANGGLRPIPTIEERDKL